MNLEFFVKNQRMTRKGLEPLVGDTQGFYTFTIEFDATWEDLVKVVVFQNGKDTAEVIYTGQMPLPAQVCGRGDLYVACHGYRSLEDTVAVVRTIRMTRPVRLLGSAPMAGEDLQPEAPALFDQLVAVSGDAAEAAGRAETAAQAAQTLTAQLQQQLESGALHGKDGQSVTVTRISGSSLSGGENTVTFSDGSELKVRNGIDGSGYPVTAQTIEAALGYRPAEPGAESGGSLLVMVTEDGGYSPEFADVTAAVAEGRMVTAVLNGVAYPLVNRDVSQPEFRLQQGLEERTILLQAHGATIRTVSYRAGADQLGGVLAEAAQSGDTKPVRMGADGCLYTASATAQDVKTALGYTPADAAAVIASPAAAAVGQVLAVKAVDENGVPTVWEVLDVGSGSWNDLTDKPSVFPPESHNQAASTITSGTFDAARIPDLAASKITAGTFAGQVAANASGQGASGYVVRNSKLSSTEEAPTVNGQICWKYE